MIRIRLLVAATLALCLAPVAHAAAPLAKGQAPGWYRMMLGDFEVTSILDGTVGLPVSGLLTNTTPAAVKRALERAHLTEPVETSVNAFLVNTGAKLVLVDTGAAGLFGPTLGNLVANLKASGYQPEQVDEIYITHLHPDHVGGLMSGATMAFPNAIVRADQHDVDFWLSDAKMNAAAKDDQGFFKGAKASLQPYIAAGKFKGFDREGELVPGIKAVPSRGHTAGHTTYVVESKGKKLVLWGDLMHVAAVQFAEPSVTIRFDTDPAAAALQRKRAYADAAKNGYLVGVAHIDFPGLGYVRREAHGYAWVPVQYGVVR